MKKAAIIPAILILALSLAGTARERGTSRAGSSPRKASPSPGSRSSSPGRRSRTRRRPRGPRASSASPSVYPGPDYSVQDRAWPTTRRPSGTGIFVAVGGSATVDLVLEPGKPEEQVAAAGSLPAIDRKKMVAGAQFGWLELQTLPTARDPWAVVALVPVGPPRPRERRRQRIRPAARRRRQGRRLERREQRLADRRHRRHRSRGGRARRP